MEIDLNCDLGEGGAFDETLMGLITSANVACGFHAGDPATAMAAVASARRHGVRIGAHPGFPDREHFGRRELERTERQTFEDCVYQIGALEGLARAVGQKVAYVKPHGALYNLACKRNDFAWPVVEATALFKLALIGLPGSRLHVNSNGRCSFYAEGFADRRYLPDGNLVPRSRGDAFLHNAEEAVRQAEQLLNKPAEERVRTLCVHGDNPQAVAFVRELREALTRAGHTLTPFTPFSTH